MGPEAETAASEVGTELLLRGALDRAPDVITAFDVAGTVVYANDAALRVLGYRRDELIGRAFTEFLHPDEVDRAVALAFADLERVRGPRGGAPYRMRRSDGAYLTFDIAVTVLDDVLVVTSRRMEDHELLDRVLDALASGAELIDVVALLPSFDLWRNPTECCVVRCSTPDGVGFVVGSPVPDLLSGVALTPGTPWARAVATGDEIVEANLDALPEDLVDVARSLGFSGCRVRSVPDPRGLPDALVTVWTTETGPPNEVHSYPMAMIVRVLDLVLRFHRGAAELRHAASHDPLTGLANRTGFFGLLPADLTGVAVTVLALDLDGFKPVNDRLGHAAGDEVLRQVAGRIRAEVRAGDVVARLGGDEFAVVVLGSADRALADELAASLRAAVAAPVEVAGASVAVGISVGVAVDAGSGRSIDSLLAEADAELYQCKAAGRRTAAGDGASA